MGKPSRRRVVRGRAVVGLSAASSPSCARERELVSHGVGWSARRTACGRRPGRRTSERARANTHNTGHSRVRVGEKKVVIGAAAGCHSGSGRQGYATERSRMRHDQQILSRFVCKSN